MDALQSFFKKYHAVPGNDRGPQWDLASDEELLAWATGDLQILKTDHSLSAASKKSLKDRLLAMRDELFWRMREMPEEACRHNRLRKCWWAIGVSEVLGKGLSGLVPSRNQRPEKNTPSVN
jgi:hypothetical protein